MSTAEEKENEDVKTVGGILKLKGNDELKFGLLIGLIELQQASNKDVVDTVLYLLVGGEFDIESNFVIQDPQNILHMLKLLASCPHTLQAEVWSVFIAMLKKSRRNLHACTEVGLIARALDLLLEADEVTADLLIDMLGVLASYSITVKELKSMFALMKARNNVWQRHSTKLISVLRHMPQRQGPDEFFSFPGKKGSHIALPPIKTWPYQSGWTFSCWMRLDPVTGVNVEREKPYLYCFRTSKGVGYSAHFVGGSLVITSMKIKGKGFQHCVKYEFQPRQWYMVTIVHVYNRWSKSEIRCYVDGHISSSGDISWVVSTSDPFDKCFIGSSAEGDAEEMFCGQMSTIYMFSEALLPQQINAMLHLGPGYKSQFRFENEILNLVSDAHERMIKLFEEEVWPQEEFEALYDGKLTSAIVFMYNPIACDSQLCLESSPKGNQSYFLHSPHAMMCQDVKAIITHSIHSTLHSLGGVQILFPLFGQLDMPVDRGPDKPSEVDYTTCSNLIGLLGDLIECSPAIQQQMAQNRGFLVISYLLEKSAKEHITPAVLEAFLTLTEFLVELPTGSILLKYLFDNILFNPQLWVHTSVEVQTKLYCYLATEFINNAQIYNSIRRVSAVLQTMHSLKYYYWVVNPLDRSGVQPKAIDGPRPSKEEILKLRSFMLLYVKELIIKGHGILEDELQSMLNYLTTLHEDDNLMDVLELLVHLMAEHPSSMVPAFDQKNGVRTVFKLLASQNEDIRLLALRLLGFFLMRSTYRRKQDAMSPHNLFSLLSERLMLHTQNITMSCYNVLFEILTERMSLDNVKVRREEPESTFRIENSAILKVVATMICQSKPTAEVLEVKKTFLSDLTILCNNNKDNRRTVLQMSVWQDWLFSLSYIYPHNSEQQRITDMVMALFKMLLHHAIKFEFGGWRVWIDTLAILHSKVAYEDFKIHMSKMYQQFEQHRADNITDPAEQQRRPISTISGISSSEERRPPHKSTVKISEVSDLEAEAIKAANGQNDGLESRRKGSEVSDSTENKEVEKRESRREKEVENGDGGDVVVEKKDKGEDVKSIESEAETGTEGKKEESKECEKPATEDHTSEKSQEQNSIQDKEQNSVQDKEQNSIQDKEQEQQSNQEQSKQAEGSIAVANGHNGASLFESNEREVGEGTRPKSGSSQQYQVSPGVPSLQRNPSTTSRGGGHIFSPGPRAPAFRIPEFRWSFLHQKLLSDLLFAVETDIQVWKSHSTKNVIDFVNASENHIYVVNVTHMISQLADNLITSCGGLLPLLAAATSQNGEIEILEPNQGLSIEQAVMILQRIMYMTDILVFASSTNFTELENEKNMPSGGILRQCLRLVCTSAVRNCLECRHRYQGRGSSEPPSPGANKSVNSVDAIQSLIGGSHPSAKNIVENLAGQTTPIKDPEKLLQDMDINRLRAVVYRDVEETKQAQFLALAIVYFCSVLMVSKYRDILEPPSPSITPIAAATPGSKEGSDTDSTHVNKMDGGESSDEREAGEDEESEDIQDSGTDRAETDSASVSETIPRETNPHQESQAKEQGGQDTSSKQDQQQAASSSDGDPEPAEDAGAASGQGDSASEDNQQDGGKKEEDLEKKKEEDGKKKEEDGKKKEEDGKKKEEDGKKKEEDGKKQEPVKDLREVNVDESKMEDVDLKEDSETRKPVQGATVAEPRPERAEGEESAKPISSISVSHKPTVQQSRGDSGQKASPLELNISPPIHSLATASADSSNLTERLERALGSVAPLLREVFVDFAPFLSKTLIGSHGQELLIGGLVTLKQSTSVVELVMLLCSQEWQNSLQKHAGLAFIELVNEGRLLAHATRDHIVRVANEAEFILNRMRAEDVQKHADFESTCAQAMMERREEEKLCDHLIKSAKRRDHSLAVKQRDKILNILLNKHGAWGSNGNLISKEFWKLDIWEDDSRRRRRMIKNPLGSSHPEATLKAAIEHGAAEDAINAAREAFHTHLASLKKTQRETTDFTDEELVMEEKDVEQEFSGPVAMSTPCKLIAPGVAVNGTMSITKNELYFEMDEEDPQNKKTDSKVLAYVDFLHGKWNFSEVRAIFSRRYLLQNVAIEIFMANRTAVMFAFPDHGTVKKVINALPRVGVGIKYGLQQARRVSMASGKQLFKLSNMTQKWQKREISNFDYIMYLNTIAGRTYNDLNQYPVFPWVLVNYDNDHLDLSSANSYRDLSKPIGALNETRKAYFEERFSSWEHDQIPPFHYGTHYSTSAFTLNWLIRVEPFTTMFLNLQGGKFDHPNRIFSSVSQAWKNCQRDTSDVKELIPEFFCLPEMFSNSNKYSLGKQEDGKVVSDVQLPPWAKTPEEFVRINKMALESEFVSCQIHNWIDLIFGYKQRGPEAVRATNVFYYLTYEGSVNLETMTDPVMKEAIENQIRSFGQTPSQLLTEPHPPRSSVMHLSPMMFSKTQDDVCMIMKFLSNSPVTHVAANTHPAVPVPAITSITCNHNYAINKWNNNYIPQANSASFSSEKADPLAQPNLPLAMDQLLVLNTGLQRRTLGDNFDQRLPVNHHSFVTTADNRFLFACGFWDKSFRVYYLDTARIIQVVFGHFDVVTCVARSECNISQDCYVVTGSKDCTVMVWMFSAKSQAILGDNNSLEMPTPRTVLTGHQSEITCVATIAELGLVVSGSRDGPSLVHSLTGDLLHSLEPPSTCHSPRLIAISREAFIILTYDQGNICMFSINGKMLHFMEHRDNIQTLILSRDGQYMLMGGNAGVVEVWRSYDFSHLYSFPVCDSCIRSLALTHDHRFLIAGLATGCLLVFNIDFNKWHHEFQERYT